MPKVDSKFPCPRVHEFAEPLDIVTSWKALLPLPGCMLLESSMVRPEGLGRFSFLVADPFQTISAEVGDSKPFDAIRKALSRFPEPTIEGLPPFQGGIAGAFAYDLNRSIEEIPQTDFDDFHVPALVVGLYDVVVAWDHLEARCWLISQGFPETEPDARLRRAKSRLDQFLDLLQGTQKTTNSNLRSFDTTQPGAQPRLKTPLFSVNDDEPLRSNFSQADYEEAVQKCIDYICAGDAFQINLSQQLMMPAMSSADELYQKLRQHNRSTFGGYFDAGSLIDRDLKIVSASPERFFSVRDRIIETRPIKGTRRRTGKPQVDIPEREQLITSDKDRAENTMIVDLMRNDLSPVCEDESLQVSQLCKLEEYETVLHLVSAVKAQLRSDCELVDVLQAVFPGGSITGAPKIRAMEIIAELEPTARGFYCGSMGYLGFSGDADLNIMIRTITESKGWWQIPVGGGVVSQSNPAEEYRETWLKASALIKSTNACKPATHSNPQ